MTRGQQFNALLEEFVGERRYVPEGAQAIESMDGLPRLLRQRVPGASADAHWRAWTDGHRIWFILAHLVNVPCQRDEEIALQMGFYDQDGVLAGRGIWLRRELGHWSLYCVLGSDDETFATGSVPLALAS